MTGVVVHILLGISVFSTEFLKVMVNNVATIRYVQCSYIPITCPTFLCHIHKFLTAFVKLMLTNTRQYYKSQLYVSTAYPDARFVWSLLLHGGVRHEWAAGGWIRVKSRRPFWINPSHRQNDTAVIDYLRNFRENVSLLSHRECSWQL